MNTTLDRRRRRATGRGRPVPAALVGALSALVLALLAPLLAAAPASAGTGTAQTGPVRSSGAAHPAAYTWYKLNLTMQAQQESNWCWAGSGNSVADYFGYSYSQNQFCNLAFDRSINSSCPNSQATLANDQEAFRQIGISPGRYVRGHLSYDGVINQMNANQPVITRIQWTSGGGHMEVLYGYDRSESWVYWGDPWPSDNRYNWASFNYYVSNGSFFWTHTLYNIGA